MRPAAMHRCLRIGTTVVLVLLALRAWGGVGREVGGAAPAASSAGSPSAAPEPGTAAWRLATAAEKQAYVDWFRATLIERYDDVRGRYEQHLAMRRADSMTVLVESFNLLYFVALAALLLPLWYWRRARGRRVKLCGYSVLAALLMTVAVVLFTISLGLLKELTVGLWNTFEPRLTMMHASAMMLYARADQFILQHDMPIGMALRQLETGVDGPLTLHLLNNLATAHERVFAPCATIIEVWCGFSAYLPHVLSVLVAVLFAWGVRDVLRRIWTLPRRAIAGEARAGRRSAKLVVVAGAREVLAVLCLVPIVALLGPATAVAMQLLVWPSVDAMFAYWTAVLGALSASAGLSGFGLVLGVIAVPVLMIAGGAIVAVSSLLFLVKALDALRLRFRRGVPLRGHDRLWRRCVAALLRTHWLPALLLAAALPLTHAALPSYSDAQAGAVAARITVVAGSVLGATAAIFVWLGGASALVKLLRAPLRKTRPEPPSRRPGCGESNSYSPRDHSGRSGTSPDRAASSARTS